MSNAGVPRTRTRTTGSTRSTRTEAGRTRAASEEELKLRNLRLQNKKLDIDNKSKMRDLVPAAEMRAIVYRLSTEAKVQFEMIPSYFKRQFGAKASEEMLTYLEELCGNAAEAVSQAVGKGE